MSVSRKSVAVSEPTIGGLPWADLWPGVERHLCSVLRYRLPFGTDPSDVVQETAARLLESGESLACEEEVTRLATRIAVNLSVDQGRRSRLTSWCSLTDDLADQQDVEREVLGCIEVAAVRQQAARNSVDLKSFDLVSFDGRPDSSAVRSRRYRARTKLKRWREGLGGALALPKLRWLLAGAATTASLVPAAIPLVGPIWQSTPAAVVPSVLADSGDSAAVPPAPLLAEPGQTLSVGAALIRPIDSAPEGPTYSQQLKVIGPAGTGAEKGTKEYPPDDPPGHVICLTGLTPLPDVCPPIQP